MTKAVLKNFAIFTGKYLCWSLFLVKNFEANLLKRNSNTSAFFVNIAELFRSPVWRASVTGYCYKMLFRLDQSKAIWLLHNLLFWNFYLRANNKNRELWISKKKKNAILIYMFMLCCMLCVCLYTNMFCRSENLCFLNLYSNHAERILDLSQCWADLWPLLRS